MAGIAVEPARYVALRLAFTGDRLKLYVPAKLYSARGARNASEAQAEWQVKMFRNSA